MYTFDPYNPLAGLQNIPGVVNTTTDQSALNSYANQLGFQGALNQLSQGLQQGNNPLLLLGRTGLGYTTGKQQAGMNLLNMSQLRQNLMKGGAELTKSGYEIGEKQFDLNKKMTQQQGLYELIRNLNPEAQKLALSNQDEFTKMMIGNMGLTGSVKEYEYAKAAGYKGTYTDYVTNVEKYRATTVSNKVTQTVEGKEMASLTDKIYDTISNPETRGPVDKAAGTINKYTKLIDIVNSGDMIEGGVGQSTEVFLTRLGDKFGVAGGDAQTRLANTRLFIKEFANAQLEAGALLKGNPTNNEQKLLQNAAMGNIEEMRPEEIKVVLDFGRRYQRGIVENHNRKVDDLLALQNKRLEEMKAAGKDTSQVTDLIFLLERQKVNLPATIGKAKIKQ